MLCKFLLALAGTQALGLRPEAANGAASVGKLGDLVASAARASASDSLESLSQASDILGSMMTAGNATEHMSDDDVVLLKSVITMIEESIYGSMDSSHKQDEDAVKRAVDAIAKCNSDIVVRLAPDGDLDVLYQGTLGYQSTLNVKQKDVEAKTDINNTKFADLEKHISTIREAPACSSFPVRPTKAKTDVFFADSEYVNWYIAQSAAYAPIAEAFEVSDTDLENALTAYAIAEAERDVSYCDWKVELTNGCRTFDECYTEKLEEYTMDVTPRVQQDMQFRIDAYKAGQLIISQIRFLVGESTPAPPTDESSLGESMMVPPNDTSRYELMFPDAAPQEECSLAPLDADEWVPKPECQGAGGPGKPR